MLVKTRAIVLRQVRYSDSRSIVSMLCGECGRLSFAVSPGRRGVMSRQMAQPLTILDIEADLRPGRALASLRTARLAHPWQSLAAEPVKLSIALFLSEFLDAATRGECQPCQALAEYVSEGLMWLDACTVSPANFHLMFAMRLTRFLGFFPNTDDYLPGDVFDLRAASFARYAPSHSDFLVPADAARVVTLLRMTAATQHLYLMSRAERGRLLDVILRYYAIHVPAFPPLRCVDVLRELF